MDLNYRTRKLLDNLYGPAGTVLIHIIVVVALIQLVHFEAREVDREVEVILTDVEEMPDLDELEPEIEELEDVPTVVDAIAPPTVSVDQEPPQVDTVQAATAEGMDMSDLNVRESMSPVQMRGLYASRSAGGRGDALRKYAGNLGKRTEIAVMKALRWLKDHQYENGSWGPSYRASMTSLALLSFFAHGETTASDEFGMPIQKGLRYLLTTQKDGIFVGGGPVNFWTLPTKYKEQVTSYEHSIATYAISEAYNLTKIPYLKKPMEDAVQVMIDGQHEAGSWDYGYVQGADAKIDVSLAGWHIQALKAASAAGAENRGLKAAIDASIRGLDVQYRNTRMFQYSTRDLEHEEDLNMTAVAVLCKQLTGHALDDNVQNSMTTLRNAQFIWGAADQAEMDKRNTRAWPFYTWYYLTQARFHQGGRTWSTWNVQFAPTLCDMQNPDGSWCPAPRTQETLFGPVYHTTLAALQLQVYYRMLPTYQPVETEEIPTFESMVQSDDIVITFGPEA